jgi:hypothetical protein
MRGATHWCIVSACARARVPRQVGLEKLQSTEESVTGMKEELIALQPQLEESTRQTEAAMEVSAFAHSCHTLRYVAMQLCTCI